MALKKGFYRSSAGLKKLCSLLAVTMGVTAASGTTFPNNAELDSLYSEKGISASPRIAFSDSLVNEIKTEIAAHPGAFKDDLVHFFRERIGKIYRDMLWDGPTALFYDTYGNPDLLDTIVKYPLNFDENIAFIECGKKDFGKKNDTIAIVLGDGIKQLGPYILGGAMVLKLEDNLTNSAFLNDTLAPLFQSHLVDLCYGQTINGKPQISSNAWNSSNYQELIAAYDLLKEFMSDEWVKTVGTVILNHVELLQERNFSKPKQDVILKLNLSNPIIPYSLTPDSISASIDSLEKKWINTGYKTRNTISDTATGMYGVNSLMWYAGLATFDESKASLQDDPRIIPFMEEGYSLLKGTLNYRRKHYGDGRATYSYNYLSGNYVHTEWNFFRSMINAMNTDLSQEYNHSITLFKSMTDLLFKGKGDSLYCYGIGDLNMDKNNSTGAEGILAHLYELEKFYKNDPLYIENRGTLEFARYTWSKHTESQLPAKIEASRENGYRDHITRDFSTRLYKGFYYDSLYEMGTLPKEPALARAVYYKQPGQLLMRSSNESNGTRATFIVGHDVFEEALPDGTGKFKFENHGHYDQGHFVIYKMGHLALDAGSRKNDSLEDYSQNFFDDSTYNPANDPYVKGDINNIRLVDLHVNHYFSQTVAHNSVLIDGRDEKLASKEWKNSDYSGTNEDVMNKIRAKAHDKVYGGQINLHSELVESNLSDNFVYAFANLTNAYYNELNPTDRFVGRKFLYFPPDYFVVYDTLHLPHGQSSRWLLHTQEKPNDDKYSSEGIFSVDQNGGSLFCRSLLPENRGFKLIGGKNRPFQTGDDENGRINFMHPAINKKDTSGLLFGNWRVEVSESSRPTKGIYCHLIQVGEKGTITSMDKSGTIGESAIWFKPSVGVYESCSLTVDFGNDFIEVYDVNRSLIDSGSFDSFTFEKNVIIYDPWDEAKIYNGGDQVFYNGHIWEARWWSQGTEPGSGGEWKCITTDPIPDWTSPEVYSAGDRVHHKGIIWEAKWWSRGTEPSITAACWKSVTIRN